MGTPPQRKVPGAIAQRSGVRVHTVVTARIPIPDPAGSCSTPRGLANDAKRRGRALWGSAHYGIAMLCPNHGTSLRWYRYRHLTRGLDLDETQACARYMNLRSATRDRSQVANTDSAGHHRSSGLRPNIRTMLWLQQCT